MTFILCNKTDCIYNWGTRRCKCSVIELTEGGACDSYFKMPSQYIRDAQCTCDTKQYHESTGGCPIHGIKEF